MPWQVISTPPATQATYVQTFKCSGCGARCPIAFACDLCGLCPDDCKGHPDPRNCVNRRVDPRSDS
jgi:hypothetical protein